MSRLFPIILTLIFLVGMGCASEDQSKSSAFIKKYKALQASFWDRYITKNDQKSKVGRAPDELIDFATMYDQKFQFPGHPKPSEATELELNDIDQALQQVPKSVFDLMGNRFYGIYLAQDLGLTALGQLVADEQGKPIGGFILIDETRIHTDANSWRTEHENLFFDTKDAKLEGVIASPKGNTHVAALRWILLHEMGHLIAGLHQEIFSTFKQGQKTSANLGFQTLSWEVKNRAYISRFEDKMLSREKLQAVKIGTKAWPEQEIVPVYEGLQQTNFPTLYAATNPGEDFSESLAAYVNVFVFHEPIFVSYRKGDSHKVFESCFSNYKCPDKIEYFQRLLKPNP